FTTFRSTECQATSPVKTLDTLDVTRDGDEVQIRTSARSFLHNQVRSMVGSLMPVGDGKWSGVDLADALPARTGLACGPVARQVVAAPADGHTLLMASTGAILSLASGAPAPFDITRELAPISLIAAPPYILVVNPAVPVRTAAELIVYAKANPGKLSFGSSGV